MRLGVLMSAGAVLVVLLAGCGDDRGDPTATDTAPSSEAAPTPTPTSAPPPTPTSAPPPEPPSRPLEVREVLASDLDPTGCNPPAASGVPACDADTLAALDCAEPASVEVPADRVLYACDVPSAPVGGTPEVPQVRYALAPARIVGGVVGATAGISQGEVSYSVSIELGGRSAKEFSAMSREAELNVDRFALVLDGVVLSAPTFAGVITDGNAQISGNFTEDQARALAEAIGAGG